MEVSWSTTIQRMGPLRITQTWTTHPPLQKTKGNWSSDRTSTNWICSTSWHICILNDLHIISNYQNRWPIYMIWCFWIYKLKRSWFIDVKFSISSSIVMRIFSSILIVIKRIIFIPHLVLSTIHDSFGKIRILLWKLKNQFLHLIHTTFIFHFLLIYTVITCYTFRRLNLMTLIIYFYSFLFWLVLRNWHNFLGYRLLLHYYWFCIRI